MNWLALSPVEIAARLGGTRGRCAVALSASPAPATPQSFHAAILGQRAADFAAAPSQASRALGISRANSFFVAARSGACESAMGPRVRRPQRRDRAGRVDLVAGASCRRTGLDRPGTRGSAARAGFAPQRRPRAAASRGGRCASHSAVHHGPRRAAPRHPERAIFERRCRSSSRSGNWPRGCWEARGAACWFTLAPAWSIPRQSRSLDEFRAEMESPEASAGTASISHAAGGRFGVREKPWYYAAIPAPGRGPARSLALAYTTEKLQQ